MGSLPVTPKGFFMFGKTRLQDALIATALMFGACLLYLALTVGITLHGGLVAATTTVCAMAVRQMFAPTGKS